MKVNFVIRYGKKRVDGQVPIEMTICVKGKRRYVSTGRFVKPKDFSAKKQTVKGDKDLNEFLQALKTRILSIETTLLNKGAYVCIDSVLDVYRYGEEEKTITFLQVFDIHTENIGKKVKQKLSRSRIWSQFLKLVNYRQLNPNIMQ